MERNLHLTICMDGDNVKIVVTEPESGVVGQFNFVYSPHEHPEFDRVIGNEIYSWLSLWANEDAEDEE